MAKFLSPILEHLRRLYAPRSRSRTPWEEQTSLVLRAISSCRFMAFFLLGSTAVLLVLGFSFQMITVAVLALMATLAPFTPTAFRPLMRISAPAGSPYPFVKPPLSVWSAFHIGIRIFVFLVWIGGAIFLLSKAGFCGQNLVCLLAWSLNAR